MLELNLDLEILKRNNRIKEMENEYRNSFKGVAVPFDEMYQNDEQNIEKRVEKTYSNTLNPEIRKILEQELKSFKQT
jgi:hypothetical protein